jgi:hypothetical protein
LATKINFGFAASSSLAELACRRLATNTDWAAMNAADHFVQFYQTDDFLVNTVAEYVIHGIKNGEACIVVATPEHRESIRRLVTRFGTDLNIDGRYVELDARETIAKCTNESLNRKLFDEVIGGVVREAVTLAPVRIFGEMVALLLADGRPGDALELETMWNEFRATSPISLFCAYPTGDLARFGDDKLLTSICQGHSRVIPDESYTSILTANDRLRAVAFLQQRARQLESELAWLQSRISAKQRLSDGTSKEAS